MVGGYRLWLAIRGDVATQTVVLDIVRHQKLNLCEAADQEICHDRACPTDGCGHGEHERSACPVAQIGMGDLAAVCGGEPVGFGTPAGTIGAAPCPKEKPIEAFAAAGAVRVCLGADETVVHKRMRGGMVTEQQRDVDPDAKAAQRPVRAVDQLMCIGIANLPENQPCREE